MNYSVAVSSFSNGARTYHVAGKIQASNVPRDMRLQRMLGHLTTLTPATPRSVLVIGCGAGITADRKSTRLNSSHVAISYAVFCLKKKKITLSATLYRSS